MGFDIGAGLIFGWYFWVLPLFFMVLPYIIISVVIIGAILLKRKRRKWWLFPLGSALILFLSALPTYFSVKKLEQLCENQAGMYIYEVVDVPIDMWDFDNQKIDRYILFQQEAPFDEDWSSKAVKGYGNFLEDTWELTDINKDKTIAKTVNFLLDHEDFYGARGRTLWGEMVFRGSQKFFGVKNNTSCNLEQRNKLRVLPTHDSDRERVIKIFNENQTESTLLDVYMMQAIFRLKS